MIDAQLVLVDFDDTLVDTAPRFERGRRELFDLLVRLGFDEATVRRVHHDEVDREMIRRHGFGPFRLEPSFRETYLRLCRLHSRTPEPRVLDACAEVARRVPGTPPCVDGAIDALRELAERLPTALYTQAGNVEYQMSCVRDSGVMEVLTEARVHIASRKTADAFRDALARFGVKDPRQAWMVGNSMRSDVNPALEVGAHAILVEVEEPWHFDIVEPFSQDFVRVPSFSAAVDFLLGRRKAA